VNDGSRDKTLQQLEQLREKDSRCCYVDLSRNFGKEAAMLAGFDYITGDAVVIMDADLQHPPHVIPQMIAKWEEGFDDVYARRVTRGKESWLRKKLTTYYYRLLSKSSRIDVLPNVGDFRLLDRQCVEALKSMREQGRYTKGMYCYIGFRKCAVDFETQDRVAGESSMNLRNLVSLALEGIMSYTTAPLRFATIMGVIVSLASFLYALWILIKTLIWGDPVAGFPTLMVIILFLGGVQLLSLGIIGEYLGRVYNESKNRPVYFARTYNGKRVTKNND
jgi:glycosyltransferase involved in cell wall biosynthesis